MVSAQNTKPGRSQTRSVWWHRLSVSVYAVLLVIVVYLIMTKTFSLLSARSTDYRPAVNKIVGLGGRVHYEYRAKDGTDRLRSEPPHLAVSGPVVRRVVGVYLPNPFTDNFFDFRLNSAAFDRPLEESHVSDADLMDIADLQDLTVLFVASTQISDRGVAHLAKLKNLETLLISSGKITDKSIPYLTAMGKLDYLSLRGTRISDEGLSKLRLPRLSYLEVMETRITAAGVREFRQKNPKCFVRAY